MTTDMTAPATKQDIAGLMEQIGEYYFRTKTQISDLKDDVAEWKDEVKFHFDVSVEQVHHEMLSANREEILVIKDRLTRIEDHIGLKAA